jgi:glycosyltransferase involved in cell wall biosynthesis
MKHEHGGYDHRRLRVKDNFASAVARRSGAGYQFLSIGRLSREKGIAQLLDSWPSVKLDVIGDGPERPLLERRAPLSVTFHGSVHPTKIPPMLGKARALIQPSRCYEAQPRAILEAFAAGVPVIASRIGGLPELVEHGVNGLLVDVDDKRGWQEAVEHLMDDSESERLGEGAYRTWQERFTPEIALRNLENAYAEAIAAHG